MVLLPENRKERAEILKARKIEKQRRPSRCPATSLDAEVNAAYYSSDDNLPEVNIASTESPEYTRAVLRISEMFKPYGITVNDVTETEFQLRFDDTPEEDAFNATMEVLVGYAVASQYSGSRGNDRLSLQDHVNLYITMEEQDNPGYTNWKDVIIRLGSASQKANISLKVAFEAATVFKNIPATLEFLDFYIPNDNYTVEELAVHFLSWSENMNADLIDSKNKFFDIALEGVFNPSETVKFDQDVWGYNGKNNDGHPKHNPWKSDTAIGGFSKQVSENPVYFQ